jgi:glycosyltransferase involved in cell wall biosynthesis
MEEKRVAIVVNSLYGGGMERVAAQLSIMLSDAGYDIYIIVCSFNKRKAYSHKGKVIVIPFNFGKQQLSKGKELALILHNAFILNRCKRNNKFDVTISFAPEMNMINMLSGTGDKKILTIHCCLSVRQDLSGLCYIRKMFKLYNNAYKVIAVSEWCKKDLVCHYGVNKDKVQVIYNPVNNNSEKYIPMIKENIVLIVGRMQDIKQQWHIFRAFKRVLEKIPDAKLVVAGQGENNKYFHRLSADMGIDNSVSFKGFVDEIDKLYQQAKCVVFSSASEAFPCSVIEAFCNGVPVVAADCPGGIKEILDGSRKKSGQINKGIIVKGGILTPRLDGIKYDADKPLTKAECKLAEGIIYVLKNESKRLELANNCLEISKLFDEKIIKKEWLRLIG